MKVIVILGLVGVMLAGVHSFETSALFDAKEKTEDRAEFALTDRVTDKEALEKAERESDKLAAKKETGDELSVRKSNDYESLYKYEDFIDEAGKNDLKKDSEFGLKLHDASSHDASDEYAKREGKSVDSALRSKFEGGFDSNIYDHEELAAAYDSDKTKLKAKEFGKEHLLGDKTENLFDSGISFEFSQFKGHDDDSHGHGGHGGHGDSAFGGRDRLGFGDSRGVGFDSHGGVKYGGHDAADFGHSGADYRGHGADVRGHGGVNFDGHHGSDFGGHGDDYKRPVPDRSELVGDVIPERVHEAADIGGAGGMVLRGRLAHVFSNGRFGQY